MGGSSVGYTVLSWLIPAVLTFLLVCLLGGSSGGRWGSAFSVLPWVGCIVI
jgi:hypothetical protein